MRIEFEDGALAKQMILSPIAIKLTADQYQIATEHIQKIQAFGFELEDFGEGTMLVRAIPLFLTQEHTSGVVVEIIENMKTYKNDLMPSVIDDLLHSISCRSAIKANDKQNTMELQSLIDELDKQSDVNFCPHGRPIMMSLSKYEIEKKFGRV